MRAGWALAGLVALHPWLRCLAAVASSKTQALMRMNAQTRELTNTQTRDHVDTRKHVTSCANDGQSVACPSQIEAFTTRSRNIVVIARQYKKRCRTVCQKYENNVLHFHSL